ncbi:hypothetical protein A6U84_25700 (plasmid) [Agrobacterium sp. 13-2099-1-2]|uniref:hypothetical protein n=1 Tax=Agrobacterium sp. 13-2099-1-2 TaxID=1841651 RepID=UPI0011467123|nr:hypothetical protein [Agrobacterium sp. 13-2099-1-2]UZX45537.1 hypothetical protein A6U84_25700 [Agrobacterium sp. 13-2099-1-2]
MSESMRVIEEPKLADVIRIHMDVQRQAAEAAIAWRVISSDNADPDAGEHGLEHLLHRETEAQEAVLRYQPASEEESIAKLLYLSALIVGQRRALENSCIEMPDGTRH